VVVILIEEKLHREKGVLHRLHLLRRRNCRTFRLKRAKKRKQSVKRRRKLIEGIPEEDKDVHRNLKGPHLAGSHVEEEVIDIELDTVSDEVIEKVRKPRSTGARDRQTVVVVANIKGWHVWLLIPT